MVSFQTRNGFDMTIYLVLLYINLYFAQIKVMNNYKHSFRARQEIDQKFRLGLWILVVAKHNNMLSVIMSKSEKVIFL